MGTLFFSYCNKGIEYFDIIMLICYSDVSDQISGCSAKTNFERTFWQHNYVMLFTALDLVALSQKREHTTTRFVPKRLTRLAEGQLCDDVYKIPPGGRSFERGHNPRTR